MKELPSYNVLRLHIIQSHPNAFGADINDDQRRLRASLYIFSFLEACIADCSILNDYTSGSSAVQDCIQEFEETLSSGGREFVIVRHMSHISSADGTELTLGNITVVPDKYPQRLEIRIRREIPGAEKAWKRIAPNPYQPPHSLLVSRAQNPELDYNSGIKLPDLLDRFVLAACLLTGGTAQSLYEVTGEGSRITHVPASLRELSSGEWVAVVRRTVRLEATDGHAIAAIIRMIDDAEVKRSGMIRTPFDLAMRKFQKLDATDDPFEQVVDLATALEAVMLGGSDENEGLTVRLSLRVSTLLSDPSDPPTTLYTDVKQLYRLRSNIVHGGELSEKNLRRVLTAISGVPNDQDEPNLLMRLGYALDRLRDILRRAILARLGLASGPAPLWPFTAQINPDSILTDDSNRSQWRQYWRTSLEEIGAGRAAQRAPLAVDALGGEDR